MRVAAVLSALVAAATAVSAQQEGGAVTNGTVDAEYVTQLVAALQAANLTSLADAAVSLGNTTEGAALIVQFQGNNKTILAPTNEAFAAVDPAVASNSSLLASILSYHILNASLPLDSLAEDPNHTVARSLYDNMMFPGNTTVPVVLYQSEGENNQTIQIQQPGGNVNGSGPVSVLNFQLYIVDQVLSLPPDLATAATELLPSLAGVVSNAGLLEPLAAIEGLTLFAPNDAAISGLGDALAALNQTQVQGILANHVINGTAVFSTQLTSSNYTSAGGQQFMFVANDTGAYVMSGNSTARIIQSDIVIANGVVHVIDGVLLNQEANTEAAASAASSNVAAATSTAAATGSNAGVVGSPTGMGTASSGAASSTAAGAATKLGFNGMSAWIGSAVAVVGGIALGASMI